jgi:purine-binding chemotaxis protein CheW
MIVDSASEVLKIPETEIEAAPAMMQEGGLDCVTGLGKYQGRLIILLDIGKVLTAGDLRHQASTGKVAESATPPAPLTTTTQSAKTVAAGT